MNKLTLNPEFQLTKNFHKLVSAYFPHYGVREIELEYMMVCLDFI